jgi:hypothetical protein
LAYTPAVANPDCRYSYDVELRLNQNGNLITGTLRLFNGVAVALIEKPVCIPGSISGEHTESVTNGMVETTNIRFQTQHWLWEGTFTSDLMRGTVSTPTLPGNEGGIKGELKLIRRSSNIAETAPGQSAETEITLPPGIPPKPSSLLASNAEYYRLFSICKEWGFDFNTTFDTYSQQGFAENWAWIWIGSSEDESKRIYFDRVGDQWNPRHIP